jgi:SAM-dependent methyltransferase
MVSPQQDIMGQAGLEYLLSGKRNAQIKVWSDIAETDMLPVHYLFRSFHEMPALEQKALMLNRGRVLDVGAGMGSHSLYLQEKGVDVTALDVSPLCCEVMQRRGVKQVVNNDFFKFQSDQKFDTIYMLMNGVGVLGTTNRFPLLFQTLSSLLNEGGQVIIDSSDLRYLFLNDDGSFLINLNGKYYGEVNYKMSYGEFTGKKFLWLFIDDELLGYYAKESGFEFEKLAEGQHYDYLGRLKRRG